LLSAVYFSDYYKNAQSLRLTVHNGTRESHAVPEEASDESKRRRRKYGSMAVGLGHIRGVDRVMPIESCETGTPEGPSSKM